MLKIKIKIISILSFFYVANLNAKEINIEEMLQIPIEKLVEYKVISSTKTALSISQAPNSVNVYTATDIDNLGARTVSDVLKVIAGIQIQTKNNNREKAWVRGVQSEFNNKIALYIDGVPYRDVFGGFPIDEEIPIETIKKMEIIRGPGSALYGANAFSGVINLYTFKPGERQKNILKAGVGERDTALTFISLDHEIANIAKIMLEGKWLTTNGRKPFYDNKGGINSRTGDQQLAYLRFKGTALDEDLFVSATYHQFENTRVDKGFNFNPNSSNPSSLDNTRTYKNLRLSLAYQHTFNKLLDVNFNSYYTRVQRNEFENKYTINQRNIREKLIEEFKFVDEVEQIGINITSNLHLIENNELTFGFEYKRERLLKSQAIDRLTGETTSFVQDPIYDKIALNNYSVFLQVQQYLFENKSTLFTAGARFDKLDLFKDQFSYRLGITHKFTKNYYAKLLYGTAYRAPNFVEFARAPIGAKVPKVETMATFEAQVGYLSTNIDSKLTFFYNQFDNFISRKNSFQGLPSNSLEAEVFSNLDNLEIIGVESESKFKLNKHWNGFLNLAWLNSRSKQQQQLIPLLANWTASAGIEWHQKMGIGELRFNNHIIAYGKRKDWDSDLWNKGQQQRYPNRGDNFNGGYVVWNTGLHYKIDVNKTKKQAVSFDLTVNNLLNETYYTQPISPPKNNRIANFDTQYQGRHVRFSMRVFW